MTHEWKEFAEKTKDSEPNPLLVKSLPYVHIRERALELGSGAGRGALFLKSQGFKNIDAVDFKAEAKEFLPEEITFTQSTFDTFTFPENAYDFVSAQYALPFNPPNTFDAMFERLKRSMKPGAILSLNFFGPEDDWATERAGELTFHTKSEIEKLLDGYTILFFDERKRRSKPTVGPEKNWHVFDVIAEKKKVD